MYRSLLPRSVSRHPIRPLNSCSSTSITTPRFYLLSRISRGYATEARKFSISEPFLVAALMSAEEHDLVIIGGGVAGYVAAIKAGQEGLKVYPALGHSILL